MDAAIRKNDIERVTTGITGLDRLLFGGVPKGSVVLLSGSPGAGKSILCLQIVMNACRDGKHCLYASLEEPKENIIRQAKRLGWPIEEYIIKGLLSMLSFDILKDRDIINTLFKTIRQKKISQIVLDSLTAMEHSPSFLLEADQVDMMITQKKIRFVKHEEWLMRTAIFSLIQRLRAQQINSFLVSEINEFGTKFSSDGVSEFLCDGLILMQYMSIGTEESRVIEVRKMRLTDHVKGPHAFVIEDNKGIKVEQEAGTKFSIKS